LRDYDQFHHIWGGFKNHRPKSALTYLTFQKAPSSISAFLNRADKAMVKVPEASNRSSRVTKVINDAVNIGAPYFDLSVQGNIWQLANVVEILKL